MVGKNIKNFREQKNITQEELAEKLSVTRQAVSNWETGKTQPDIDTLHKISDILEISIEELISNVATKGGCTRVGIDVMEEKDTAKLFSEVIQKTTEKASILGN